MKRRSYSEMIILMMFSLLLLTLPELEAQEDNPGWFNSLGMYLGINNPIGREVLQKGAYPIGLNLYFTGIHKTPKGFHYELLAGADMVIDYSGGIYLTIPVLINRIFSLIDFRNQRYKLHGFSGLGYSFHHIFSRTKGITVKNQYTLGLNAGIIFRMALGEKWSLYFRMGVFHSFTKPVQAYFAGTRIRSEFKFHNTTLPLLIGFSKKLEQE